MGFRVVRHAEFSSASGFGNRQAIEILKRVQDDGVGLFMVFPAFDNHIRPVYLFGEHDPGKRMRQGDAA